MKRQVTKDITSYFSFISKRQANIQAQRDIVNFEEKEEEQRLQETIAREEEKINHGIKSMHFMNTQEYQQLGL